MTQPQPAPSSRTGEPLEQVREFMNTIDVESATDEIGSREALEAWLGERRHSDEPGAAREWFDAHNAHPVSDAEYRRALELRGALRELARANHEHEADAAALSRLNRIAAELPMTVRVAAPGDAQLVPTGKGLDAFLAGLLAAVFVAMRDGSWNRVKICAADTCQWAFFDASKNRSGNWCSMRVCGNRAKVRKYQQRRRAREQGAGDE